jgi:hypothetical protein
MQIELPAVPYDIVTSPSQTTRMRSKHILLAIGVVQADVMHCQRAVTRLPAVLFHLACALPHFCSGLASSACWPSAVAMHDLPAVQAFV